MTKKNSRQVPRALHGLYEKLCSAIKEGQFTPFLGAGASSVREVKLSAFPWKQVMATISEIATHLQLRESLHYVRIFAAQRLGLLGLSYEELQKAFEENSSTESSVFHRNGLIDLQVELIHATVRLMEYFGNNFAQETPSLHELSSCSVPFDPAALEADESIRQLKAVEVDSISREAHAAILQLFKVASIARELRDEKPEKRESPFLRSYKNVTRSIDIQRIHEKIVTLIVTLLGYQRESYSAELARHKLGDKLPIPVDVDNGDTSDFGRLRLDAVQWMSELLWYTIRYWVPCYPTTAELAFELSLKVGKAPARRAELAQAAQALENEYLSNKEGSLADDMAALIRYCEHYQRDVPESIALTSAFHYGIVTALQHQFDRYRTKCLADPDLDSDTVPIVFTTNFDNALEQVFKENDLGYHVLYPTIGATGRSVAVNGDVAKPVWRIRTYFPDSEESTDDEWDVVGLPKPPTASSGPGEFIGPLVLKIHGAPLLRLKPESRFKHWLVLSEADYLQALATASNMPGWVKEQLGEEVKSQRYLWFLGYSISDWNVRLRLFEHCKKGTHGLRGVVDREADPYRTALLANKNINVEQWIADLSLLPQQILDLFVIDRPQCTTEVSALVQKLEKLLEGRR